MHSASASIVFSTPCDSVIWPRHRSKQASTAQRSYGGIAARKQLSPNARPAREPWLQRPCAQIRSQKDLGASSYCLLSSLPADESSTSFCLAGSEPVPSPFGTPPDVSLLMADLRGEVNLVSAPKAVKPLVASASSLEGDGSAGNSAAPRPGPLTLSVVPSETFSPRLALPLPEEPEGPCC